MKSIYVAGLSEEDAQAMTEGTSSQADGQSSRNAAEHQADPAESDDASFSDIALEAAAFHDAQVQ